VPVWPALTADECDALSAENAAGYLEFLGRLDADQLHATVRYRTLKGEEWETPVVDILLQGVLHAAHHRGQFAKCLARAGAAAPIMDFLIYAREAEPPRS
jgi:uncharacterized damage-inducible protein DinB